MPDGTILGTANPISVVVRDLTANAKVTLHEDTVAKDGLYVGSAPAGDSIELEATNYLGSGTSYVSLPSLDTPTSSGAILALTMQSTVLGSYGYSQDIVIPFVPVTMKLNDASGTPVSFTARVNCNFNGSAPVPAGASYAFLGGYLVTGTASVSGSGVRAYGVGTAYSIANGSCPITYDSPGQLTYVSSPLQTPAGGATQNVDLPAPIPLSGSLGRPVPTGAPAPQISVTASNSGAGFTSSTAVVNADGSWTIQTSAGQQSLYEYDRTRAVGGNNWILSLHGSPTAIGPTTVDGDYPITQGTFVVVDSNGNPIQYNAGTLNCAANGGWVNPDPNSVWNYATLSVRIGGTYGQTVPILPGMTCALYITLPNGTALNTSYYAVPSNGTLVLSETGTVYGVPQPVTGVSSAAGDHSATVTWLKPGSSLPIYGYLVTATPGGQTCTTDDADILTCTITGLQNDVNYTFTVTARSLAGSSSPTTSSTSAPTVPGPPPSAVTGVSVDRQTTSSGTGTGTGDGTQATVVWLKPYSDPHYPIIGYRVTAEPGDETCQVNDADIVTCTVTGLTPGVDYSFTVTAINGIGASTPSDPVVLPGDTTPPVVTGTASPAANSYGWNNGPVTVNWTATDNIDGTLTPPPSVTLTQDGAGQTATSVQVCDTAGNCATGTLGGINIDTVAPAGTAASDRAPNAAGWYNSPVTVIYTCDDALSGVASCPSAQTISGDGKGQSVTGAIADKAGNTAPVSATVNVDTTAPTVGTPVFGTNPLPTSGSTTLTATASDALSGVVGGEVWTGTDPGSGNGTALTYANGTLTGTISGLAPGIYTVGVRSQDAAGNWSAAQTAMLVVYDPTGGFATGGGWITPGGTSSDTGDLLPGMDGTSKANFGFVVKYQNGQSTVPSGNFQFVYHAGNFTLHSTGYQWLVVTNSQWAHFQGAATINGGTDVYPIRVDARDSDATGTPDRLVLRIYAPGADPASATPIYQASGDVDGGHITIHSA